MNFTSNLKTETPWGTSPWSHTDLTRLVNGRVGGQVRIYLESLPAEVQNNSKFPLHAY